MRVLSRIANGIRRFSYSFPDNIFCKADMTLAIFQLEGVKLDNAFLEYLDDRIGEHAGGDQIQAWQSLPELFRQYHALFALDSDQFNGGFEQYFRQYAAYTPFVEEALAGLAMVGNAEQLRLAREAVSIFVHYFPKLQSVMDSLAIAPTPRVTETDIDRRFQSAGDLQGLRIAWLEANRDTLAKLA